MFEPQVPNAPQGEVGKETPRRENKINELSKNIQTILVIVMFIAVLIMIVYNFTVDNNYHCIEWNQLIQRDNTLVQCIAQNVCQLSADESTLYMANEDGSGNELSCTLWAKSKPSFE